MNAEDRIELVLSREELWAMNNALNEVCHGPDAIPDGEFQSRMGVGRTRAIATLERLKSALG